MEKYGFTYIWRDRKHKRYYVGCHWGTVDDGYVCSSTWMKQAWRIRPHDFKRRILKTGLTRKEMYAEEQRLFSMIKSDEIKPKNPRPRYYNLQLAEKNLWHSNPEKKLTVGQKISAAKKGKSTGPRSEECKEKIRQKAMGNKRGLGNRGNSNPHTDEWKRANSERMKRIWAERRESRAQAL